MEATNWKRNVHRARLSDHLVHLVAIVVEPLLGTCRVHLRPEDLRPLVLSPCRAALTLTAHLLPPNALDAPPWTAAHSHKAGDAQGNTLGGREATPGPRCNTRSPCPVGLVRLGHRWRHRLQGLQLQDSTPGREGPEH